MENNQTDHIPEAGKKQSSIEYYKESIDYLFERYIESEVEEDELISRKDSIFKEVEEMHKKEIMDAVEFGFSEGCLFTINCKTKLDSAEQYYNETYNPQNNDN